jgi:ADP-ribose pyrophosphatase
LTQHPTFTTREVAEVADVGFLKVQVREIETPTGSTIERVVVMHPGAVAVVPVIDDDVILIEQYRAAVDAFVLEIPAGKIDHPGHDHSDTARRELEEETGYTAAHLTWLTELWTTVGFSDERITIFLAEGLVEGHRNPVGAEEEAARLVRMPLDEAVALVAAGTIVDAKTIAGILLAAMHRGTP